MDHSYSKERTKVQKIDHSYFTVGKKTPAVVLRKAQLQKQDQCQTRPGVDQDHSYTRPDLSDTLIITEIFDNSEREEEEEEDPNADSVTPCAPMYIESPRTEDLAPSEEEPITSMLSPRSTSSQTWRSRPIIVQPDDISQYAAQYENEPFDYGMENEYSSQETDLHNIYERETLENPASADDSNVIVHSNITYDLDEIDCLISDINLDHAYEVRSTIRPRRRVQHASYANDNCSRQSDEEMQQPMDDDCVAQGDHNYLDLHALNSGGARSSERVTESSPSRYSFRFDDHTYLQTGRTKGASTHSIERVLKTDHTYLQSDEYTGTSRIRKAKSETNLTGSEQPRPFVGSSWCQRSDDHTYLNSDEGQRMVDDQGSDDSQGTADCVDTQSVNDNELGTDGCYQSKRPYRHSCTGLADHSYEADIYSQLVDS